MGRAWGERWGQDTHRPGFGGSEETQGRQGHHRGAALFDRWTPRAYCAACQRKRGTTAVNLRIGSLSSSISIVCILCHIDTGGTCQVTAWFQDSPEVVGGVFSGFSFQNTIKMLFQCTQSLIILLWIYHYLLSCAPWSHWGFHRVPPSPPPSPPGLSGFRLLPSPTHVLRFGCKLTELLLCFLFCWLVLNHRKKSNNKRYIY